jgi:hypothetical protein
MGPSELVERYRTDGVTRVPRAFSPEAATGMADSVWTELDRVHVVRRDDRATWPAGEARGLGRLRAERAFAAIGTDVVEDAVTKLVTDRPPGPHDDWGGALVTFPATGAWRIPAGGWHLDYPVRGAPASALVLRWLAYLAPTEPGGGGTVAITGSHRLVAEWSAQAPGDPGRSASVRDAVFASHPWLLRLRRDAPDPGRDAVLMAGADVRGVPVRVVELTGQPGDVVFLHPHVLHAAAPNHGDGPRIMVTGGLYMARWS